MTIHYPTYPAYRETGIAWLPSVPKGWEVKRLKYVAKLYNGSTPKSSESSYWDGNINWITPEDLSNSKKHIATSKRTITIEGYNSCGVNLMAINSIILSTRAPIGLLSINKVETTFNQGCKGISIVNGSIEYLYYILLAHKHILNSIGRGTTFLELSQQDLGIFPLPFPPLPEQQAIAEYLDHQTAKIDLLQAKIDQQMALLSEYRTSLITAAVTGQIHVTGNQQQQCRVSA